MVTNDESSYMDAIGENEDPLKTMLIHWSLTPMMNDVIDAIDDVKL